MLCTGREENIIRGKNEHSRLALMLWIHEQFPLRVPVLINEHFWAALSSGVAHLSHVVVVAVIVDAGSF